MHVCLSVRNVVTFDLVKFTLGMHAGPSSVSSGHVCISRSSGQGQGHKRRSRVVCLRLKGNLVADFYRKRYLVCPV